MCGILGYIGPRSFDAAAFGRALDTMANRGPDDRGIYEEPECLLGHRRLAILDLSSSGHQPMASHDGRYIAVYNGEVYNFKDLRHRMEEEGVAFHSSSDTEVLLEHYARMGPDCARDWRGMFAIAIWDNLERCLFLARDRMGIKPLYIWPSPAGLAFSSEVKALRALPGGPSAIKPRAVAAYLAWGSVPEPKTILAGVEALAPGTWGFWKDGTLHTEAYWSLPQEEPTVLHRGEAIEMLRPILREAVALRCISDAPLGAFLSGGIDSSSVVALMRAAGQQDLRTFSISFPQTAWDEGPFALKVAEEFGTLHADIPVTEAMVRSELDGFFQAMDQPTCDGVNTYLVSKFARQGGLTVSLSGLGGDELFAGYPSFNRVRKAAPWLRLMPGFMALTGGEVASVLGGRLAKLESLSLLSTQNSKPTTHNYLDVLYYATRGLFMPSQIRKLLHPDLLASLPRDWSPLAPYGVPFLPQLSPSSTQHSRPQTHNVLRRIVHTTTAMELRAYMLTQLLRDSDVFGMGQSLEIRVPLLDHKLVEALFKIDESIILRSPPKSLLLDALPSPLPSLCTNRPKMGFTFPFDAWMKGPWKGMFEPGDGSGRSILNPSECQRLWSAYSDGRTHWSRPWTAMALQRAAA